MNGLPCNIRDQVGLKLISQENFLRPAFCIANTVYRAIEQTAYVCGLMNGLPCNIRDQVGLKINKNKSRELFASSFLHRKHCL